MKVARYLLPVVIVLTGLLLYLSQRGKSAQSLPPPTPAIAAEESKAEAERILSGFNAVIDQAVQIVAGVKDAATANTAIGQLQSLGPQIDKAVTVWSGIPQALRPQYEPMAASGYQKLKAAIDKALTIPGVREKFAPAADQLLSKLSRFA